MNKVYMATDKLTRVSPITYLFNNDPPIQPGFDRGVYRDYFSQLMRHFTPFTKSMPGGDAIHT